jgi:hypothetical protein
VSDTRTVTREQLAAALTAIGDKYRNGDLNHEAEADAIFAALPQPAPAADGEPRTAAGWALHDWWHQIGLLMLDAAKDHDHPEGCNFVGMVLAIEAEAAQPAPGLDPIYEPIVKALAYPCREPIHQRAAEALAAVEARLRGGA